MTQLTIKGQVFDVQDDPAITIGVPLSEGMVAALQQTRRENIRNNMSRKVEEALNGAEVIPQEKFNELQSQVNDYAAKYEFGVRQPGTARVTDPVEKEAREEATKRIRQAYFARHNTKIDREQLGELVDRLMDRDGDMLRDNAREAIRRRENTAEDVLAAIGA